MDVKTLLLGGHMPRFDGLESSLKRAEQLGFSVVQLNIYIAPDQTQDNMTADEIDAFKKTLACSNIKYVVALDPYLEYLAKPEINERDETRELIIDELELCGQLGISYLIVHPGTCSLRSNTDNCIIDMASSINEILGKATGNCMMLLQNMVSGNSIFYKFENLAQLYRDCNRNKRIGFCFDMCAAFASGYSFSNEKEYHQMWEEFDKIIGLDLLKAIHINDSKMDNGSGVISHADIGKGRIPYDAYRLMMNDRRFMDIPKIIEIPLEFVDSYKNVYQQFIDFLVPSHKQLYGIK